MTTVICVRNVMEELLPHRPWFSHFHFSYSCLILMISNSDWFLWCTGVFQELQYVAVVRGDCEEIGNWLGSDRSVKILYGVFLQSLLTLCNSGSHMHLWARWLRG